LESGWQFIVIRKVLVEIGDLRWHRGSRLCCGGMLMQPYRYHSSPKKGPKQSPAAHFGLT
jgi:hypothetical protein